MAILSWFGCGGTFKGRVVHTSLGQVSQSPLHPDLQLFQTQHINIFSRQPPDVSPSSLKACLPYDQCKPTFSLKPFTFSYQDAPY